jgi:hypothetical protein
MRAEHRELGHPLVRHVAGRAGGKRSADVRRVTHRRASRPMSLERSTLAAADGAERAGDFFRLCMAGSRAVVNAHWALGSSTAVNWLEIQPSYTSAHPPPGSWVTLSVLP